MKKLSVVRLNKTLFTLIIMLFILFLFEQYIIWSILFKYDAGIELVLKSEITKHLIITWIIISFLFILTIGVGYVNRMSYYFQRHSQRAMLASLAGLAEFRDPETGRHLDRTKRYTIILAKNLSVKKKYKNLITKEFMENLSDAAPLHDIGKVGIPDSILLKPGKLTEDEFYQMKKHPIIGKQVIKNAIERFNLKDPLFFVACNICSYHHEKYNGSGYIEGLKAEEIPLEARIFALCDVYDALRARRPYKEEMTHEKARNIILADSGKHFDPDVVEAFKECEDAFQEIHNSYKYFLEIYEVPYSENKNEKIQIAWNQNLSVNIEKIDAQHQELFKRINSLLYAISKDQAKSEIGKIISFLNEYTLIHFTTEEQYMIDFNYPEFQNHIVQHVEFIKNLAKISKEFDTQGPSSRLVLAIQEQLGQWFVNHIAVHDKALGSFLNEKFKAAMTEI
ncbi:response regulator receiver modulated metal dependent phosphohydrolase [Candidatus Magnetoovum chiemensis]|nr:response regulator receiver modulated metal dependent phosphohydrolase [Candidatus Magnetoovum chiemensis]